MAWTRLLTAFKVALQNGIVSFQKYYQQGYDPFARDELTLAFNRSQFERRRQEMGSYSLLLIDLDNFKSINDKRGHLAGDLVLKSVAAALRTGSGDRVFRVGGEEFAVLLRCDLEGAKVVAERLCRLVRSLDILDGQRVTVSVGVASHNMELDHDSTYRLADEALYTAKGSGKDRVTTAFDRQAVQEMLSTDAPSLSRAA